MAAATKSLATDRTIRQPRWMGCKLLAARTICSLAVAVLCLLAGESRAFTPVPGVYYRRETASDGLLVSTNSVRSGNSPNAWAYAGDDSESWQFLADNTSTNYQLLSQAGDLTMGCNSGDPKVYLQTPATPAGSGQFWYVGGCLTGAGSLQVALPSALANLVFTVLGDALQLSCPAAYQGWLLQSDSIELGAATDWFAVPGSGSTNQMNLNIIPSQQNVFFRLVHP